MQSMHSTDSSYDLDKTFTDNVATYLKEPSNWRLKPDSLSPAQCARFGWRCVGKDLLSCTVCKQSLCAHLPAFDSLSYEECLNEIVTSLKKKHKQGCPWLHVPKPEKYIFLLPLSKKEAQNYFKTNWDSLLSLDHAFPNVECSQLQLSQDQLSSILSPSTSLSSQINWKAEKARALLALTGWSKDGPTSIKCSRCQRVLELKAFSTLHSSLSNGTSLIHSTSSFKNRNLIPYEGKEVKESTSLNISLVKAEHHMSENRTTPQKLFKKQNGSTVSNMEGDVTLSDSLSKHIDNNCQDNLKAEGEPKAMSSLLEDSPLQNELLKENADVTKTRSAANISSSEKSPNAPALSSKEAESSKEYLGKVREGERLLNMQNLDSEKSSLDRQSFSNSCPSPSYSDRNNITSQNETNSSPINQPLPCLNTDSPCITQNLEVLAEIEEVLDVAKTLLDEVLGREELTTPSQTPVKESSMLLHNLPLDNEELMKYKGHYLTLPPEDTNKLEIASCSNNNLVLQDQTTLSGSVNSPNERNISPDTILPLPQSSKSFSDINPQNTDPHLPTQVTREGYIDSPLITSKNSIIPESNDDTTLSKFALEQNSDQDLLGTNDASSIEEICPDPITPNKIPRKRQNQSEVSCAKKPKLALNDVLDPLYEHRSWCSWMIATPPSGQPGWKVFWDSLFPPPSRNEDTLKLKWARALQALDSWNQPHI